MGFAGYTCHSVVGRLGRLGLGRLARRGYCLHTSTNCIELAQRRERHLPDPSIGPFVALPVVRRPAPHFTDFDVRAFNRHRKITLRCMLRPNEVATRCISDSRPYRQLLGEHSFPRRSVIRRM